MRLTTKGRFAVTAMIDLAMRQHHGPVTLAGISQRQEISLSYLIIAVDEPLDATQCGGKENCHGEREASGARCMTHDLWATLNAKMVDYLDSVSLKDLVDQQKEKAVEQKPVVVMQRSHQAA